MPNEIFGNVACIACGRTDNLYIGKFGEGITVVGTAFVCEVCKRAVKIEVKVTLDKDKMSKIMSIGASAACEKSE